MQARFGWTLLAVGIALGACAEGTQVPFGEEDDDGSGSGFSTGTGGMNAGVGGDDSSATTNTSVATTGGGGMQGSTSSSVTAGTATSTTAGQTTAATMVGSTGSLIGSSGSLIGSVGSGGGMGCMSTSECAMGECCYMTLNICGPTPPVPGVCLP